MATKVAGGALGDAISGAARDTAPEIDLGNLTIVQTSLAEDPGVAQGVADATKSMATRLTQELLNQLYSLPFTSSPEGRVVQLPDRIHPLPREKPLPQPKPLTTWEKFAKEKGIVKKKRSKLVFDEATQDWKRRHGYGKANDAFDVPIIEASDKDKDGEDPFARMAREKATRTKSSKASGSQLATTATEPTGMPATVKLSTKLDPASVRGQIAKGKTMSKDLKQASYLAGVSTASMGKFDKRLRGEGENERKLPGSRKKVLPLTGDTAEHASAEKVLGKVLRKSEGALVNVQRAVGNLEAERARAKHSKRSSGDGSDDEGGSGKRKKGRVGRVKNRRVPKQSKVGVQKGGAGKQKGKGAMGKQKGPSKKR